jgi:hypothetical protein
MMDPWKEGYYDVESSDETNLMRVVVFAGDTRGAQKSSTKESLELADGDKKIENFILLHERFSKLGAPLR